MALRSEIDYLPKGGGDFKYPLRVAFHLVESIKTRADVETVTRLLTVPAS